MDRFPHQVVRFVDGRPERQSARGLPLAFVHINKTAGTTFTQYLRAHFLGRPTVAPPFFGDFQKIGIEDQARELYWGHFTYSQFCQHRPAAWFITFLREPIERVMSQYRSLHNPDNLRGGWADVLPPHAQKAMAFAQSADFPSFVMSDDPFILGHIQDLQTRFISSYVDPNHPQFLSSALENLERAFLFVGTTEHFDESIQLFRYQLGSMHDYEAAEHVRNVSKRYPVSLTAEIEARLHELVKNDLILYDLACKLLQHRLTEAEIQHRFVPSNRGAA